MKLHKAIQEYLADRSIALSVGSIRNYTKYLKRFEDFIGDVHLSSITNLKIRKYQEMLKSRMIKDSTLFEYSLQVQSLLKHFGYDEVAKKVGLPKYVHDSWPEATPEHIQAMLKVLKRKELYAALRDELIIIFKEASGMRTSEITDLHLGILNFQNRSATIVGKGKYKRTIHWNDLVNELLQKYLDEREAVAKCDYLFINRYGYKLNPNHVCVLYKELRHKANIHERIVPHSSRVGFITKGVRSNLNIAVIQALAGHKHLKSTQVYIRLNDPEIKRRYDEVYNS